MILVVVVAGVLSSRVTVAHADDERSPQTAMALALGGTAVSVGLFAAGARPAGVATLVLTPSFGQIYAGEHLTVGMGIRAVGAAMVIRYYMIQPDMNDVISALAGGAIAIAGTLVDLHLTPDAANSWNARHQLRLTPTSIDGTEGRALGLGLSGRF